MIYLLLALNILCLVAGQVVWKMGLDSQGGLHLNNIAAVLFSPLILLGIVLYGLATVLWLFVLSRLPLSAAYPLQSLAYVIGLVAAWQLFGEAVPPNRWLGAGVIVLGVMIVGMK
ncbi:MULTISPECIES: EamA family transporter [unclassified Paenibacillus]|uniref:EamA family transporter n=1 Tax=unclassified Paenibacillus TaxID=185978 RepID=UPI001C11CA51|nr:MULTISPECIES: EamA family transporter [unclassified Paenibacillus]MBU5441142.1 EamA family transporter [Paenibacillus sp. MSJ-34]CAH0120534.1 4-amino-4-deoxy-L-arabinose-phosphoundecaprenol flippase subunit ArnE [Paenibacillus sp. CECT 9249]